MLTRTKGQGLIETLIIFIIIAFAVLALIQISYSLIYEDDTANQQTEASQIALTEIETLRDYTSLTAYNNIASGTGTATGLNTTYTITWTVNTFTNPTYKKITVAVTWTDRAGTAQSVSYTTNVSGIDPAFSGTIM